MSMPSPIQWIFPSNKFIDLQFFFLPKKIKCSYKVCRMEYKLKYFNFIDDRKKIENKIQIFFNPYKSSHREAVSAFENFLSRIHYRRWWCLWKYIFLLVSIYINLHTILRMKYCKKYDWIMLKIYDVRFSYSYKYECGCV